MSYILVGENCYVGEGLDLRSLGLQEPLCVGKSCSMWVHVM